jgi:hypothetical protein
MKKFDGGRVYTFEKEGSFGRFVAGDSFPVDYIMTTFTAADLKSDLTFARDIRPEQLDFEMLMQRDIDEERVRKQIEPYLRPQMTAAEIRSRAIFFPPLLVAIIPVKGKKMQQYYPDETGNLSDDEKLGTKVATREWQGLFKLSYFTTENAHAYNITLFKHSGPVNQAVDLAPVKLETRPARGNEYGASLVVIDGQHRLRALIDVYEQSPDLLKDIVVPVCILFSPNSTQYQQTAYGQIKVPSIPEVFRHLFVDVNSNTELVGGHFRILLSDESIGSLVCRKFCDQVLQNKDQEGLAVIEWNTKALKESTIVKREYSLTSIGVIEYALRKSIGENKNKALAKYLLNLAEVEAELYPEDSDSSDHPKVGWSEFSLSQKKILEKQVEKYVVPCLEEIFFSVKEYSAAYDIFRKELDKLKKLTEDVDTGPDASQALSLILEYIPIKEGKHQDRARDFYRKFEANIKSQRELNIAPIIKFAIFQRAVFDVWAVILETARGYGIIPANATKGLVTLLDHALKERGQFFAFDRSYMQHTVFIGSKVKPTEETRKALANLIGAHLGNSAVAKNVCKHMGLAKEDLETLLSTMNDLGQRSAGELIKQFEKQKTKHFKSSYPVDFSIDKDEREKLTHAENEQKQHVREMQDGKRRSEEVSTVFIDLVNEYVKQDVLLASAALQNSLEYDTEIYGIEDEDIEQ